MQIRYTITLGEIYYSVNDINSYLISIGCDEDLNLGYDIRRLVAKANLKNAQYNFNQSVSIKPFDEFMNYVWAYRILSLVSKKDYSKAKSSGIFSFMDDNRHPILRSDKKEFLLFKEVSLIEISNPKKDSELSLLNLN